MRSHQPVVLGDYTIRLLDDGELCASIRGMDVIISPEDVGIVVDVWPSDDAIASSIGEPIATLTAWDEDLELDGGEDA